MSKTAELSNPFSTGAGGANFERHVQAVFILAMIIDGFSPSLNAPITRLDFQGKRLGYDIDDLIVSAEIGSETAKLHCQIKRSVSITESDDTFQEIINAAWNDFNQPTFNLKKDKLALITGFLAKDSIDAMRYIHEQALHSIDENDFLSRVEQSNFSGESKRKKFRVIKKCLNAANDNQTVSELEIWNFCKVFELMVFDLDYAASVNRTLINTLIQCNSKQNPNVIWAVLSEKAAEWNQAAASKRREDIPDEIYRMFGIRFFDFNVTTEVLSFVPDELWAQIAVLGAWDENNEHDIALVERITNSKYMDFQHELQKRLMSNGNILTLTDGIWRVQNQKYLFEQAKDLIFDNNVKAVFEGVKSFLHETSHQFSEDGKYDIVIPANGKFDNSDILRNGVLQGICLLANEEKPKYCSTDLIEREAKLLIEYVFANCTWIRIASLGELLLILAEIHPKTYLNFLEKYIIESDDIVNLFPKKTQNILIMPNFITEVLFSLELLAWSDHLLVQTIRCLGELENKEYDKTNYSNTPLNSIINILTPFKPQTYASIEKQEIAVKALTKDVPDICWEVVSGLLPGNRNIVIESPKPRYIKLNSEDRENGLDSFKIRKSYEVFERLAIQLAENNVDRMAQLAKSIEHMSRINILKYLEIVSEQSNQWDDREKFKIWTRLSDLKCRMLLVDSTEILKDELFEQLVEIVDIICPGDILYKHKRLYLAQCKESIFSEDGWRLWDDKKTKAVYEIYLKYGIGSLLEFSNDVENIYDVARRLGESLNVDDVLAILEEYQNTVENNKFYSTVMRSYLRKHSICDIYNLGLDEKSDIFKARVLMDAPLTNELLNLIPVALEGKEELYWDKVPMNSYDVLSIDCDIQQVISQLIRHGRPIAAVNIIGNNIDNSQVEKSIAYELLLMEQQSGGDKYDRDAVCNLIRYLQNDYNPDINQLSEIEFMYLPWLGDDMETYPRAINYRLSNDPEYFCRLMECAYKKRHSADVQKELPETIAERIYEIVFMYSVIPGISWDGSFSSNEFIKWLVVVKQWARENDRIEVVLQTIGNGFSYAQENEDGLIEDVIMQELNDKDNEEMRKGYRIGVMNQRGVHWLDPEGAAERALADKYYEKAKKVEELGYSRFSETLLAIGDSYIKEADNNAKQMNRMNERDL